MLAQKIMRRDGDTLTQRIHRENVERKCLASFVAGLSCRTGVWSLGKSRNQRGIYKNSAKTKRKEETKNEAIYQKFLKGKLNYLPTKERQLLGTVLWK